MRLDVSLGAWRSSSQFEPARGQPWQDWDTADRSSWRWMVTAPVWPRGTVGSMTHCDGFRASAH